MNKSIPLPAAALLEFIYLADAGHKPPLCYETIFGNRQNRLSKPITQMTLKELQENQKNWSSKTWVKKHWRLNTASSASGAPQLMRDTLEGLIKELKLDPNQLFTPDLQDLCGYALLKRRGYQDFMDGAISLNSFAKKLAMEWASFPVLVACRGAHRQLRAGETYYAGDGLNQAQIKPAQVRDILTKMKKLDQKAVIVDDFPDDKPTQTFDVEDTHRTGALITMAATATTLTVAAIAAAWEWIMALPCNLLGIVCGG